MKISSSIGGILKKVPIDRALELYAEAGFKCVDLSMSTLVAKGGILSGDDYREQAEKIRDKAKELRLEFNQAHGPFPDDKNPYENYYSDETFDRILRCIEVCGILGIPKIVIHPTTYRESKAVETQINLDYYNRMLPSLKKHGVKVCIENLWGRDKMRGYIEATVLSFGRELVEFYKLLDEKYFGICLDVGHSSVVGQLPEDAIREVGKYLTALHIHDTTFVQDSHIYPFNGKLDWIAIAKALADIDYNGEFTFEVDYAYYTIPEDFLPVSLKYLHDIGEFITAKIEEFKIKKIQQN